MEDFVKKITNVWNQQGGQAAHDCGEILLRKIADEIRGLQGQRTAITALMQHFEASGARATAQMSIFENVKPSDRPQVILDAAAAVLGAAAAGDFEVSVQEVLAELQRRDLDLGVQQPLAVIGTVLSRSDHYQKVARNTFQRVEPLPALEN